MSGTNLFTKLGVHIKCQDIKKSLAFYQSFDWEPVFAYGSADFRKQFSSIPTAPEHYCGVVFTINEALVEITDGHMAVKPKVFREKVTSSKISLMIDVMSLNRTYAN